MDVFEIKEKMLTDYASYIRSFINVREKKIRLEVDKYLDEGNLWPEALIQLNPSFENGGYIDELVHQGLIHPKCANVFRMGKKEKPPGISMRLHRHQLDAIKAAREDKNYVLTTGTGSGKSLAYVIPIVDYVLRQGSGKGIKAIIVYPMNALANSQENELEKFLCDGYPDGKGPVTFRKFTGQEKEDERQSIRANPPDILLTNYMMLELILTRYADRALIEASADLKFLVLDELHTYRGRQGADVAMMVRRLRELCGKEGLRCIGTSATLAGAGTYDDQRREVAEVASMLFGATVEPEAVIMETLRRTTENYDPSSVELQEKLRQRVENYQFGHAMAYEDLFLDPLYRWIESTFGITTREGRLVRQDPISLGGENGAAALLSELIGVDVEDCIKILMDALLIGYNCRIPNIDRPALAFRLHQFVSRGDTVYTSLEIEDQRYISFTKQQFVPGSDRNMLLPLCFCRECGQEYYVVTMHPTQSEQGRNVESREPFQPLNELDDKLDPGFLYINKNNPWPESIEQIYQRVPDDWLEDTPKGMKIKKERRGNLPQQMHLTPQGLVDQTNGQEFTFVSAPFRFCLNCGVSYNQRQKSDLSKIATLDIAGRSTATTILSLSAIRNLKLTDLPQEAKKLLSFTDNRQDASLQAGHFNDFVEVGFIRAAIYKAVLKADPVGLSHQELPAQVFNALQLPLAEYASNSEARFAARDDTEAALRAVLGYRIYCDLRRGWRITSPNLEQCGILNIEYSSIDELCQTEDVWEEKHEALRTASPEIRKKVLIVLLDYMRRELAIKVDYLRRDFQEQIVQRSNQRLIPPWGLDESEARKLDSATILYPRTKPKGDKGDNIYLSEYSGFAQYLTRTSTFPEYTFAHRRSETPILIRDMLDALTEGGLLEVVDQPREKGDVPGYQVVAASLIWKAGDGSEPYRDPIRVPNPSIVSGSGNLFFLDFYKRTATENLGIHAREHTAQVPYELRLEREEQFTKAALPILYCSPTMELGVDIAQLNMVNMRNIPPTPANYAQRSGRAGRQGQPALVFSYCTLGSSHDQYFFRRPERMVAGAVTPPRIDLANEDLVRSHVHASWLTESRLHLGTSLVQLLDLGGAPPGLKLLDQIQDTLKDEHIRQRAARYAGNVLKELAPDLRLAGWYDDNWTNQVLQEISISFDEACKRWRTLYLSAFHQVITQTAVVMDHTRSIDDQRKAKHLRAEAEAQLDLLRGSGSSIQDDFYSYRYFASEGFLPGYNFPRLPLSAYISGRRIGRNKDEYISRPRFLAISEFGPGSLIYHEGSRYQVNRVLLPVDRLEDQKLPTQSINICPDCAYLHVINDRVGVDCCERCGQQLDLKVDKLFRMQNVSTKRRDKITSDEEERSRQGYDLLTVMRFAERSGEQQYRLAEVELNGEIIARLYYGQGATIWRINQGRKRRKDKGKWGFNLDLERGYWVAERDEIEANPDDQDPVSQLQDRVIPYVEDHRNCLLFEPAQMLDLEIMASLQAALRKAIQIKYQLEENEIAVEPLPDAKDRRILLFYEASEGGAGVLRRLVDDPQSLPELARIAMDICHYNPVSGEDLHHAPGSNENCEVACYDCLMSYRNQTDHLILRRDLLKPYLETLSASQVSCSPGEITRAQHLQQLVNLAGSELERTWLRFLEERKCRLPSRAQVLIPNCNTRPDFMYDDPYHVVVYIDGPPHDYPERQARDHEQQDLLENMGYQVIRFHHRQDWVQIIEKCPNLFGVIG